MKIDIKRVLLFINVVDNLLHPDAINSSKKYLAKYDGDDFTKTEYVS